MVVLDERFAILNRYDVAFFNNSTMRTVWGHGDYLPVLKALDDAVIERQRAVERELATAAQGAANFLVGRRNI